MSATNPYAPPGTVVADVGDDPGVQAIKLWPPRGRIGRLRLLAYGAAAWLLVMVVELAAGFVVGAAGGGSSVVAVVSVIATIAYVIGSVLLLILRSHDMDWSGWMSILALIPLIGLIWLLKPGSRGVNRFGAPPPPNTLGVKILACVFPLIFVIGILAAIAIPAYEQYTVRARAAQSR